MHAQAPNIECSVVGSVTAVPAADWDRLVDANDPFMEHAFLAALESSGSVGARVGWLPRFVLARQGGVLVGAVPAYLKSHSHGEFVFDWSWAIAAEQRGIRYYPKLVVAVPFTPVTGRRLLSAPDADRAVVTAAMISGLREVAIDSRASSVHVLFCTPDEKDLLAEAGYAARMDMQFHWTNRAPDPFSDFDDYLNTFRSRHRKQIRKERAQCLSGGLRLSTKVGSELDAADWTALARFYRANASKHDAIEYLTSTFFEELRRTFAHRVVATLAYDDSGPVAGTLNFERGQHIYGRYWGTTVDQPMLHFELCYHRLIERAIAGRCGRFEAGAGGEHKLARGLLPSPTFSTHLFLQSDFARQATRFCAAEAEDVTARLAAYRALSPFAR